MNEIRFIWDSIVLCVCVCDLKRQASVGRFFLMEWHFTALVIHFTVIMSAHRGLSQFLALVMWLLIFSLLCRLASAPVHFNLTQLTWHLGCISCSQRWVTPDREASMG